MYIYAHRQHDLTWWALCTGEVFYSEDLAYVGHHDLRIKSLYKSNTYLTPMKSVSHLSCRQTYIYIQGATRVNLVISIMLQGHSFPVSSHLSMWIRISGQSSIHSFNSHRVVKICTESVQLCNDLFNMFTR